VIPLLFNEGQSHFLTKWKEPDETRSL
jgi:hypothetical protein